MTEPALPVPEDRPLPARHHGRTIATVAVILLAVMAGRSIATNPNFQWAVVGRYFLADVILQGLLVTLALTASVMVIAIVLGMVLAVMRMSPGLLLSSISAFYIWFFRGTPTLVQLIFWYNLASLYPTLSLSIPFGPQFFAVNANVIVTPWAAAILGLGLCEAAYMAEIARAGILSLDEGQGDAARALGMPRSLTFRRVILPQALRVIIPPTGNETIGMLKWTSLASVISVQELLGSAEVIYSRTFEIIPLLLTASLWYLICTTVLSVAQHYIEKRFGRGATRLRPLPLLERLRELADGLRAARRWA